MLATAPAATLLTKEALKKNQKQSVVAGKADDDKSDQEKKSDRDDKSSDAGSDSSGDTDSTTSSEEAKGINLRRVGKNVKKMGKEFKKLFINYGPPYRKYGGPDDIATSLLQDQLLNECCKPEAYLSEIHSLLNKRVNPNYRDEYDLYYTAMHWCARRCHVRAMKMLRRAKADVNILNEFGQTPLILSVLTKQTPDFTTKQQQTIQYLLNQGALINVRDRGGYCAIDYAVMNQDILSIKLLLQNGADIIRDNQTLVAQRKNILTLATDPDVRALLKKQLVVAHKNRDAENAARQLELDTIADDERRKDRLATDIINRELRAEAEKEAEIKEYCDKIMIDRMQRINEEVAGILRTKPPRPGKWTRVEEQPGHWSQQRSDEFVNIESKVYGECSEIMKKFQSDNKFDTFNERWKKKTGGTLEMEWNRDKKFVSQSDRDQAVKTSSSPLDFRDENDEELEGEDLDDLLSAKK